MLVRLTLSYASRGELTLAGAVWARVSSDGSFGIVWGGVVCTVCPVVGGRGEGFRSKLSGSVSLYGRQRPLVTETMYTSHTHINHSSVQPPACCYQTIYEWTQCGYSQTRTTATMGYYEPTTHYNLSSHLSLSQLQTLS